MTNYLRRVLRLTVGLPVRGRWSAITILASTILLSCVNSFSSVPIRRTIRSTTNTAKVLHSSLALSYRSEVCEWLSSENIPFSPVKLVGKTSHPTLVLGQQQIGFEDTTKRKNPIVLHLLASPSPSLPLTLTLTLTPATNSNLTDSNPSYTIIHLHQDVWNSRKSICQSRILARAGTLNKLNSRHYARQTTAKRISAAEYLPFLNEHHLWGATKARYAYGLYSKKGEDEGELVAVAAFSARRHILRNGNRHNSHELIRLCSKRDGHVVGGMSKLIKAFIRDRENSESSTNAVDDIVTVIDREWGTAKESWHALGFETVQIMPPLPMVVGLHDGLRRHLVGAGIRPVQDQSGDEVDPKQLRIGLTVSALEELETVSGVSGGADTSNAHEEAVAILKRHGMSPVYDTGIERLMMLVKPKQDTEPKGAVVNGNATSDQLTATQAWELSTPRYTPRYYSNNAGIHAMLRYAETAVTLFPPVGIPTPSNCD